MLTKSRLIQLLTMLSLLIGLITWRTLESINEQDSQGSVKPLIIDDAICDFSKACAFNTPFGVFTLSVDGGKIVPETWFHLTLKNTRHDWKVLSAKTIGKTMFMGKVPIQFSTVNKKAESYQSTAKSMIGVCTTDRMRWRFDIVVDVEGTPVQLYYDFVIVR